MTMATLQDIAIVWIIFPQLVGRCMELLSSSRRLCSSGSMTHPSTETQVNSSHPISKKRSYRTTLHSILSNTLQPPLHSRPNPSTHLERAHNFTLASMVLPRGYQPPTFGTMSLTICACYGAIYGKHSLVSITFSLRPDEAMFELAWQKLVYDNQNNCLILTC